MRARCISRASTQADDLAAPNLLSRPHVNGGKVGVDGHEGSGVVDPDHLPVSGHGSGVPDPASSYGVDGGPVGNAYVDAPVEVQGESTGSDTEGRDERPVHGPAGKGAARAGCHEDGEEDEATEGVVPLTSTPPGV